MPIRIRRTHHRLVHDARRVLAKPYLPGDEVVLPGESRANLLMARVLAIPEADVKSLNAEIAEHFGGRHHDLTGIFERNFAAVAPHVQGPAALSSDRRWVVGAYFTHE